ncbi:hypothetical protein NDU88_008269 [Pleurodeles waltl]|uniref:Uncharacterized protein n=1 Tax=Pleurodeles waltl TaxID=8319 RepID=A0AAV7RX82_PLEWA|nr:hypothetical protein NDU88_008269 [Pleurodeles waltl]
MKETGGRVSAMEERKAGCEGEVEWLHQELLQLQEQHIELQAQAKDLENHSLWNNIRIGGVPSRAEGSGLNEYIGALFRHILGASKNTDIQLDLEHRVGSTRPDNTTPSGSMMCVHDFQMKEAIPCKAREAHPIQFRGHSPMLYQDLAAVPLPKCWFHSSFLHKNIITAWARRVEGL